MAAGKVILMGTAEIGLRLKVTPQRASQIVGGKGFPDPYQVLLMGRVWDEVDVEAWIAAHRPHLVDPAADEAEA